MKDTTGHGIDGERPYLLIFSSVFAMLGCATVVVGTLVAQSLVADYSWISDTISDLAAGELEWIMDYALYGFATALLATALAAAHAHLGGVSWSIGTISLAFIAGLVIVIAARDEYGDADSGGVVIHSYLVYALGLLFCLVPLCFAPGVGRERPRAKWLLILLAIAWTILAPAFMLMGTALDGLVERLVGLIAVTIVLTLAWVFFARGCEAHRTLNRERHRR